MSEKPKLENDCPTQILGNQSDFSSAAEAWKQCDWSPIKYTTPIVAKKRKIQKKIDRLIKCWWVPFRRRKINNLYAELDELTYSSLVMEENHE